MAFGLAPLFAGRMKKPLAKVSFASGFSYLSDAFSKSAFMRRACGVWFPDAMRCGRRR
jgi:hypothetical protein